MKLLALISAALAFVLIVMTMAMGAALGGSPMSGATPLAVSGIPPEYLQLYVAAAQKEGIDWAVLAAIGFVETDHGRSKAPGVHSGRNSNGCCAGPMQFSFDTWKTYGNGGSIYDPVDAIPAAARYLKASGAPKDYHAAILSYNHAEWYYRQVMAKAEEYRSAATAPMVGQNRTGPVSGVWLVKVPGTGLECDARIIPNVQAILERYHARLTACYAANGHEPGGEHPLGLAVDLVPASPSSWETLAQLARFAGWREACASSGCASQTRTAFRFVGWNGYPSHGDPAHCNCGNNAHLHLSWEHGPGRPASWVSLVGAG